MKFIKFKDLINRLSIDDNDEVEFDEFGQVIFTCKDKNSECYNDKATLKECI